jgi:hypothetical protein
VSEREREELRAEARAVIERLSGRQPSPEQPVVYFVRCPATGLVKIGYATNVRKRLAGLQTGSAAKLELLCTVDPVRYPERTLHHRFRADRVHGEWFRPSEAMRRFLRGRVGRLP